MELFCKNKIFFPLKIRLEDSILKHIFDSLTITYTTRQSSREMITKIGPCYFIYLQENTQTSTIVFPIQKGSSMGSVLHWLTIHKNIRLLDTLRSLTQASFPSMYRLSSQESQFRKLCSITWKSKCCLNSWIFFFCCCPWYFGSISILFGSI